LATSIFSAEIFIDGPTVYYSQNDVAVTCVGGALVGTFSMAGVGWCAGCTAHVTLT